MALGARRAGVQEEARQESAKSVASATEGNDSQAGTGVVWGGEDKSGRRSHGNLKKRRDGVKISNADDDEDRASRKILQQKGGP